jgi:hypothetical protein
MYVRFRILDNTKKPDHLCFESGPVLLEISARKFKSFTDTYARGGTTG